MPGDEQEQERETVVTRLRSHGRAMFWPTLFLAAVAGATGYLAGTFDEQWQNLALLIVAAVLIALGWLLPFGRWLARNYTITTRRIVLRSGLLVRIRQELLHSRGYDVTVRKSALQALFRSGDVRINTGFDTPVILRDVPSADLVQAALHDLMEANQNTVAARRRLQSNGPNEPTTGH